MMVPDNDLRVAIVSSEEEFVALRAPWSELLASSRVDTIFLTWEWAFHWWQAYGEGKELFIVKLENARGELTGLAPLYRRRSSWHGLALRELLFLGSGEAPYPDYLDVIARSGAEAAVAAALAGYWSKEGKSWDLFRIVNANRENACLNPTLEGLGGGFAREIREKGVAYLIDLPETREAYLAGLSRNSRRNMVKRRNRLEQEDRLKVRRVEDASTLEEAFREFGRMHQERMAEKKFPGKFSDPRYAAFHISLAKELAARGRLNLRFLEWKGKLVAARYGFIYRDTVYDYQCGYDPEFGEHDVGNVLLGLLIEEAIARKAKVFDFLSGAYQFKESLSNRRRDTVGLDVINLSGRGAVYRFARRARQLFRREAPMCL